MSARRHPGRLTRREMQILGMRAAGRPQKDVAARLGISEQTTKNICTNAFRKLDVIGLVEAMNELGWVTLPDNGDLEAMDH